MCLINSRSVCNKTLKLNELCTENSLDILLITETWLTGSIKDNPIIAELTPPGFNFIHEPRTSHGGGVAVLHNSKLSVRRIKHTNHNTFECLEVQVTTQSGKFTIFIIYRPPYTTTCPNNITMFLDEFDAMINESTDEITNFLITGDLNIQFDQTNNYSTKMLNEILSQHGLIQHCKEQTHNLGHILDLVISDTNELLVNNISIVDLLISDHSAIFFDINVKCPQEETKLIYYRRLNQIDGNNFKDDIMSQAFSITEQTCINKATDKYNCVLTSLLDLHAPVCSKKLRIKPNAPWFNVEIQSLKRIKRQAERKWLKSNSYTDKCSFRNAIEQENKVITDSRVKYYAANIQENVSNPRKLFKIMDKILNPTKAITLPSSESDSTLAKKFSDFFLNKIIKIRHDIVQQPSTYTSNNNVCSTGQITTCMSSFKLVSLEYITKMIISSKSSTCELDPIPTEFLKKCVETIAPIITHIVNISLETGTFSDSMKKAVLQPLIKKITLDSEMLPNYRPISNLSYLSKITEKTVSEQIIAHISSNNMLHKWQSAYKALHSTETALLRISNDILREMDKNQCVFLILLDLSAAFDTIDHEILLNRLDKYYNLKGTVIKWLTSYLHNRQQCVKIRNTKSEPAMITHGVPQGSVLGPYLFTLYIKPLGDILDTHNINYHVYADDTQLYLSFDPKLDKNYLNSTDKLQKCLFHIKAWMKTNFLKLNENKTEALIIGKPHVMKSINLTTMRIGNHEIHLTPSARNIGVIIDKHMSLSEQINNTCRSCYMHIKRIWRIRPALDIQSTKSLVHAMVTSRLDFANSLYYGLPEKQIRKLQKVQNSAARVILKLPRHYHITPYLKDLHWLPVRYRIRYKLLCTVNKCLRTGQPTYLAELLEKKNNNEIELRSNYNDQLKVPLSNSIHGDRAFSIAGPKEWNCLPQTLRCIAPTSFQRKLKTHLYEQCYNIT